MQLPGERSALGFALLPIERADFRALGAQWQGVARTVAEGMHAAGLLGADDPALIDGRGGVKGVLIRATGRWREKWGPQLAAGWRAAGPDGGIDGRVGGVVEAAWEGRHEIVRETAAVGIGWSLLASVWLGMAWMVLELGVTPALAAVPNSDLAKQVLGDLLPFLGSGGTLLSQGLGTIVGSLSVMAYSVFGLATLVTLVIMIVEAATSRDLGESKNSWTMFALRILVVGTLLFPVSGGWSLGSRAVALLAAYGSEKASDAWAGMAAYLVSNENWVGTPTVGVMEASAMAASVVTAEACRASVNLDPRRNENERVVLVMQGADALRWDYETKKWYGWSTEVAGACGTISYADSTISGAIGNDSANGIFAGPTMLRAHRAGFEKARKTAADEADKLVTARLACLGEATKCAADPDGSTIAKISAVYRSEVEAKIAEQWKTLNGAAAKKLAAGSGAKGWAGAGEWAQTLSRLQGSMGAAGNAVPQISAPAPSMMGDGVAAVNGWYQKSLVASGDPIAKAQLAASSGLPSATNGMLNAMGTGLWKSLAEIPSMNPLAGLSLVGQKVWVMGVGIVVVSKWLAGSGSGGGGVSGKDSMLDDFKTGVKTLLPGGVVATALSGLAQGLEPILVGGGLALIVTGMGLAYLVPALPYIRFLFGVASWLVAVLESVVMVIVALVLVVTPESGGFFGGHMRGALANLLALFVRPLLTLAGFIMGLMLCSAFVALLNATMLPMIRDVMDDGLLLVSFVAYMIIYLGTAYVLVNTATKAPDLLASAAYRWTGASAGGGGDEGAAVSSTVSNAAQSVMREIAMRSRGMSGRSAAK